MKKRFLQETNWTVFLVLLAALFLIVNYFSYRHYARWDVTRSGQFSLSGQTLKVLKDLKAPLKVVVFISPGDELFGKVKDLLTSYAEESPQVKVEYIDPDRDRARVEALAEKYKVSVANVVVFDAGDHNKYVERDQMVEYDFAGMQYGAPPKVKAFKAEEAFTNAILELMSPSKAMVYFTAGHGERWEGEKGEGIRVFRDRLEKEGNEVKEWESLGKKEVPADADLLVVANPQRPFLPEEAALVNGYLEKGGRALFLLDPVPVFGPPPSFGATGLEDVLKPWGVTLGQDICADPGRAVPYLGAQTFFAAEYSAHPIVKELQQNKLPVLFSLAQSLGSAAPGDPAYSVQDLLTSSGEAWGEKDLAGLEKGSSKDPADSQGPLRLAVAVSSQAEGKKTRLVVVGDSDLATDDFMEVGGQMRWGNLLFCLNAVHWLLEQESRIAIPAKSSVETHLTLTSSQSNFMFLLFVVVIPGAVIAAGVAVYMKRKR